MPPHTCANIDASSWKMPAIFRWLQENGNVEDKEMYRTFNCGIGMVLVVSKNDVQQTLALFSEENIDACIIGEIGTQNDATPCVNIQSAP